MAHKDELELRVQLANEELPVHQDQLVLWEELVHRVQLGIPVQLVCQVYVVQLDLQVMFGVRHN